MQLVAFFEENTGDLMNTRDLIPGDARTRRDLIECPANPLEPKEEWYHIQRSRRILNHFLYEMSLTEAAVLNRKAGDNNANG